MFLRVKQSNPKRSVVASKRSARSNLVFLLCITILFTLCVTAFMLHAQEKQKEEKELVIGIALHPLIPNTSFGGKGMADARELFQIAADEVKKLYGYTITLKIYPAPKFLLKALQYKTLDCSFQELSLYLYAKNHGISVTPLASANTTGEKETLLCIYVHKDSVIKSVKELKGKSFVISFPDFLGKKDALPFKESYFEWIMTKKILAKNGITVPFKDFFKEFKVLPAPWESVPYSVMLKKFDSCVSSTFSMQSLKNYDAGFSELVPLPHSCISSPADNPLFCRSDADMQTIQKLKTYFLSPPKGSQFEKIFKKEFKGIKPYAVKEKDYSIYFQWLKEAEKKGWLKEFDEIMKNTPLPKKKGKSQ